MATKTACDVCGAEILMPRQRLHETKHAYWEFDLKATFSHDSMSLPQPRDLCLKCLADLVHAADRA